MNEDAGYRCFDESALSCGWLNRKDTNPYHEHAVLVWDHDEPFFKKDVVYRKYLELFNDIGIVESEVQFRGSRNPACLYEWKVLKSAGGKTYLNVVRYEIVDGAAKIEFEYLIESMNAAIETPEIDSRRKEWMQCCDLHKVKELTESFYHTNAYYITRGLIVHGNDKLRNVYSYMANESYSLALSPICVRAVNHDTVVELGGCSGSYGDFYFLVWNQGENGVWKISLDTNY